MADNLDDLGTHKLGELVGRLTAGEQAAVLDGALDELVGVERFLGLLGDGVGHVGFADMDDGLRWCARARSWRTCLPVRAMYSLAFCGGNDFSR